MAKDGLKICLHKRYFHYILHLCEPFSGISTNWKIWIKWRIWKRKEWRGGSDRWRMEDECSGWRPRFSTSSFFSSPPCQWRAGGPLFYPTWQLAFLGTSQFFGAWDVVIWGVHIFLCILRWQKGNRTSGSFDLLEHFSCKIPSSERMKWFSFSSDDFLQLNTHKNIINHEVFTPFFHHQFV